MSYPTIDEIVHGHSGMIEPDAWWARYMHATRIAEMLQLRLWSMAVADGSMPVASTPRDVTARVWSPKTNPAPAGENWQWPMPLVVIDSDYYPHTAAARPVGNLIWLRPSDAGEYVRSLQDAGVTRNDIEHPPTPPAGARRTAQLRAAGASS